MTTDLSMTTGTGTSTASRACCEGSGMCCARTRMKQLIR
jgi:hypothetical protein